MFGDYDWLSERTDQQEEKWQQFLSDTYKKELTVIEYGAGFGVPTIRMKSEALLFRPTAKGVRTHLIRVNPRD
jgi:hypothetical protein